jgi:hypothetical protein
VIETTDQTFTFQDLHQKCFAESLVVALELSALPAKLVGHVADDLGNNMLQGNNAGVATDSSTTTAMCPANHGNALTASRVVTTPGQ